MFTFPYIDMVKTGENIKALRKKNGYSVRALQEIMGFATTQAIYKWESAQTTPSIDNLLALSFLFHVRIEDILVCTFPGGAQVQPAHAA